MKRRRCKCCGGEYSPVQSDGSLYFHACPPTTRPAERMEGVPPVKVVVTESEERPNKRDERLVEHVERDTDGNIRKRRSDVVSEGEGFEELEA